MRRALALLLTCFALCWAGIARAQPSDDAPPADAPPEQPAPEQPAPEQPAPEQPAPEQPAPEQPAPEQPAGDDGPQFDSKGRQLDKAKPPPPTQRITQPELKEYAAPEYPAEAKKQGLEGEVILKLLVDKDGSVSKAEVVQGAGHGMDEAALAAAPRLLFHPAKKADGTPFRAFIRFRYEFKLDEQPIEPPKPTTGLMRGTVVLQAVGEPIAGATLTLTGPVNAELITAADGSFDFGELPEGNYSITIVATGYDKRVVGQTVLAGEEYTARYQMTETAGVGVLEVVARSDRPPREVTRRTIERREIDRIPGTQGDALRSIQSLPGVARPPALLGALLVRGSAPFDSQTFIDGVYVPLIYHFGGLSSVVPTELLSKIDFYPGNFSARYGRAMGGIIDAGFRSPRSDGYHGLVQLDLIDARLMAEGPIPWTDDKWAFAIAARRSWLDAWLGPALEEFGAGVTTAPRYYDYQLVVEGKPTGKDKFRTTFYGSDDRLEILLADPSANEPALAGTAGLLTAFQRVAISYENDVTSKDRVEATVAFGHDNLEVGLSQFFFVLEAFELFGRFEYQRKLKRQATMNLGLDVFAGVFDVGLRLPAPPRPGQPPNQPFSTRTVEQYNDTSYGLQPALYVEFELTPNERARIVPGVRLDYTQSSKGFDVSPRLNGRYAVINEFPKTTLKGGIGVFHQPPQYQQAIEPLGTAGIRSNRAIHYGLGVEQDITQQLEVSVEGFYKQLDDLVVSEASLTGAHVEYTNNATGYVVGSEVLLKYKPDDRLFGWVAYTLSRSTRRNGPEEPEYLVTWDQTHILTMLASYRLGGGWEFGARFRVVSGNLTSPSVCDFNDEACDEKRVNALYHGATGAYTPIRLGGVNNERFPAFHQLDIRVDKVWEFALWKFSAYLDIQNAYNSGNVEGLLYNFNFTDRAFITGIPILPTIGLRGEF